MFSTAAPTAIQPAQTALEGGSHKTGSSNPYKSSKLKRASPPEVSKSHFKRPRGRFPYLKNIALRYNNK